MNNPILSICIPTYNRAHYLKECLKNIVLQFKDTNVYKNTEIVISDNASEDNTKEIVAEYKKKFNNINYYINEKNLQFDRNVDNVLKKANGQFCWTLSDDEFLTYNSIAFILQTIKNYNQIAFICINNGGVKQEKEIELFKDGNAWLEKLGLCGGQISQNIYNKKYLTFDRTKYFDNLWIHFSIAKEISVNRPSLLVKNLFKETNHPSSWAKGGNAFTTYIYLKKIISEWPNYGYNNIIISKLLTNMARGLPKNIASAKIWGLKIDSKKFKMLCKEFYQYPLYLLTAIIIFFTPTTLLKMLKNKKLI